MLDANKNSFLSRSLYFSAYLLATGFDLIDLRFDEAGGFFWFEFGGDVDFEKLEKQFELGMLDVNAKKFTTSIMFLKRKVAQ